MGEKIKIKMNKKDLITRIGTAALVVGIPYLVTAMLASQEKQRQKIIKNPAKTVEYIVVEGDCLERILKKSSHIPSSVNPKDVELYTLEISGKKDSTLYSGEKLNIPIYGNLAAKK